MRLTFAIMMLVTTACSHIQPITKEILSASFLNSNSESYDGKTVIVKGYINIEPGGHVIYESADLAAKFTKREPLHGSKFSPVDYIKFCLTIVNWEEYEAYSGKSVVVRGKFNAHYRHEGVADLGSCPLETGIIITSIKII